MKQYLIGGTDLEQFPVRKYRDPVCYFNSFAQVMRYKNRCCPEPLLQTAKFKSQIFCRSQIQAAHGFIEQKDFRVRRQGPCKRDPLLFSSTELPGISVSKVLDIHGPKIIPGSRRDVITGIFFLQLHCIRDIFADRQVWKQGQMLKQVSDISLAGG